MKLLRYIKEIALGLYHLLQGMYISMLNMLRPKITEKYPENRKVKVHFERFRGLLTMPHNDQNQHKCTACALCQMSCPNGTISVISKKVADEATGKEKRVLDRYLYDVGSCTFCSLCTAACPQDAIAWTPFFEHTVYTRSKLVKQLNLEGSTVEVKTKTKTE
jgi:NADH-quinone oxidoreductase subunit I